jgi:Peptidase family C25
VEFDKQMKRGLLLLLCSLPLLLFGQSPNSWINFNQSYYRIPVAQEGVYRLTYSDLLNAGFPINSVDPRLVQIIHRGVEQAVVVQGESNAVFDNGDYIEFYGEKNDGTQDKNLYKPVSAQPHSYYNIYSDTTAYFLTWNLSSVRGKRIINSSEVNVNGLPVEGSQTGQRLIVYAQEYSGGESIEGLFQYSYFNVGEGWTGSTICTGSSGCTGQSDFTIDNLNGAVNGPNNPQLELQLLGRDNLSHMAEIYVGPNTGSLRLLTTYGFNFYESHTITSPLNLTDIGGDGRMIVRVRALGVAGVRDRLSVSYIKVSFPQNFNMTGLTSKKMTLAITGDVSGKSYVEVTNPPASTRVWDITDVNNISSVTDPNPGAVLKLIVPNTTVSRTLLVTSATQFITPRIKAVSFRQINPTLHDYLIITHRSLTAPGLGYINPVRAYAAYRASDAGGGYDTLTVTVDQLYNQFNYGETSSRAIYEFMKFMYAGGNLKYLFLIGKSREVNSGFHRKTTLSAGELKDLVPVAGFPASDAAYTAGLGSVANVAAVSTGRITASTPAQVAAYLNKIKEAESAPLNDLWHKQILHLSGGIQPGELSLFREYMGVFEAVAESNLYGGLVKTLGKHEATAIELINISEQVNNGVNMITFFGHSGPNATDIDIGYVSDPVQGYNNPGKYPVFLVNGCNAGEFFNNSTNFGEDWILTSNKGARNFIANSSYGLSGYLKVYTDFIYQVGFADANGIRSGIGDIQVEAAKRFLNVSQIDILSVGVTQQMILLGDPSIKLFGVVKPDFEVTSAGVSAIGFDKKPVTALADSFALKLIVKNFGVITSDPLKVRVVRTFTDNTSVTYDSVYTQPERQDTLTFIIRQKRVNGFGNNSFTVTLDPVNDIDEVNESNNQGTLSLFIPLSGTKNIFPAPYSIVNKTNVDLVFQNTDLSSGGRSYLVELDTTDLFNSTVVQRFTVSGKVLLKQKANLLAKDSVVYYWRTKLVQPASGENSEWQVSSFAYIIGSPEGWTQMHFPQLSDDAVLGLVKDPVIRKLKYKESSVALFIKTFGKDNPAPPSSVTLTINGTDYWHSLQGFDCRDNTINLIAFDKITVVPYLGIPFTFQNSGRRACGREPQLVNSFLAGETETGNNDDLIKYVNNVHASDSVVLFTLGDAGTNLWSANVKNKLGELGISVAQINGLIQGEPVVILGKKGAAPGTAKIIRTSQTPEAAQELVVNETLTGKTSSGTMQSTVIGPASVWKNFQSRVAQKTANDEVRFDLYGVKLDGTETLIQSNIGKEYDLSSISTVLYPQLKLVYFTKDETDLTPAQLKKWFVFFDPVAEGLLFFRGLADQQTLQEGQSWKARYSFTNISERSFTDSLSVNAEFFNKSKLTLQQKNFKIKAPSPGDSTLFEVSTLPQAGLNDVDVFVNKRVQAEMYYENNTIELIDYLNVLPDRTNPLLDVNIDGRYVQNGEYVSPNPSIVILLKDENRYIFKTDTTGVDVLLKYPCATDDCRFVRINLSESNVKWKPASATADFKIEFNPRNLPDGEYMLMVQAKDASGNKSGADPFEVTFQVLHETTINFVSTFPNPSSTDFFFRFVITGEYGPDQFLLQIWSPDGRLINQFNEKSLTDFHVGTHELKWNGEDSNGSLIHAGVYIYRMVIGTNGKVANTHGKLVYTR